MPSFLVHGVVPVWLHAPDIHLGMGPGLGWEWSLWESPFLCIVPPLSTRSLVLSGTSSWVSCVHGGWRAQVCLSWALQPCALVPSWLCLSCALQGPLAWAAAPGCPGEGLMGGRKQGRGQMFPGLFPIFL